MVKIKKVLFSILLAILISFSFCFKVQAKEVNVYMFYGKTCPHCEEALEYLNSVKEKYDLNIIKYEVWYEPDNKMLMNNIADYLDINVTGVPFTIIDNTPIIGYSKGITDETYKYHIKLASKSSFIDKVGIKLGVVNGTIPDEDTIVENNEYKISMPFIGNINLKKLTIPLVSVILGIKDSFNLCSIWILLFLVGILMVLKNHKKAKIIIATFVVISAISHIALILSNYSYDKIINIVILVRLIIAIVSIIFGAVNLNNFANLIEKDDNLSLSKNSVIIKIKKIINKNSFVLVVIGIMMLAISKTLIETLCSTGEEGLFIEVLKSYDLNTIYYFLNFLIYTIFFMVSDLIILLIISKIMSLLEKSNKYKKYSSLICGMVMLLLGLFLIAKPEWLMFNF